MTRHISYNCFRVSESVKIMPSIYNAMSPLSFVQEPLDTSWQKRPPLVLVPKLPPIVVESSCARLKWADFAARNSGVIVLFLLLRFFQVDPVNSIIFAASVIGAWFVFGTRSTSKKTFWYLESLFWGLGGGALGMFVAGGGFFVKSQKLRFFFAMLVVAQWFVWAQVLQVLVS